LRNEIGNVHSQHMIKNYWDKIKKEPTYLYGCGWEVRYEYCEYRKQMVFIWPSFEGVKRVEKTKIKNEVKSNLLKLKILSQASTRCIIHININSISTIICPYS